MMRVPLQTHRAHPPHIPSERPPGSARRRIFWKGRVGHALAVRDGEVHADKDARAPPLTRTLVAIGSAPLGSWSVSGCFAGSRGLSATLLQLSDCFTLNSLVASLFVPHKQVDC